MAATGAKWSKDESRFGKQLMKKAGWEEGKGLGRNEDGITEHVKTTRKDNTLGIGYEGQVQQVWSTQSVGFADILKRINTQSPPPEDGSDNEAASEEDAGSPASASSPISRVPTAGRHAAAYTKRRNLKTEALRSTEGKAEVLGAASSSRKRGREDSDEEAEEDRSTLVSPLLQRMMQRCPKHEPRRTTIPSDAGVAITKPDPRPSRPTDTPFYS